MAVTLVVAWDADLKEPLEARRSVNLRHARQIAEELEKAYPWSPRISFYQEVDFLATEAGMTPAEVERAKEQLAQRYSAEEIRHAHEIMEHGGTDITDLVRRKLEESE